MKLLQLRLENYQGIISAEYDFDGKSAVIYGDNATGKTTIKNAHCWLLLGCDGEGNKDYTPKTNDNDGDYIHNLDHLAEEKLQLDDGRIMTIKKIYHEVYKRKRGSASEEFSGNTVDYYINEVPVKETEYKTAIIDLFGSVDRIRILTMPEYFPSKLSWQERRKILMELCGDISDESIINSTPELHELQRFLLIPGSGNNSYTVDEYRKIAAARRAEINSQLKIIPARIDEARRAIPDVSSLDESDLTDKIKQLNTDKERLERESALSKNNDSQSSVAYIAKLNAETALSTARANYTNSINAINLATTEKLNALYKECSKTQAELVASKSSMNRLKYDIERLTARREALLNEYKAVQAERWTSDNEICPTCKRQLPPDEVEQLRSQFNINRSERLAAINNKGKTEASKETIDGLQSQYDNLVSHTTALQQNIDDISRKINEFGGQLKQYPTFESTDEFTKLYAELEQCKQHCTEQNTSNSTDVYTDKINDIKAEIHNCESMLVQIETAKIQQKRADELERQEKNLATEFENIEQGIYLCELFIKQKVQLINSSVNNMFESVRFRMFIQQNNGGLADDCEVLIPSKKGALTPYTGSANDAGRINGGLEIIKVLSKHWNIEVPIFVDRAESVTHLIDTDTQTICLQVSKGDYKLRVVLEDENLAKQSIPQLNIA